jgi:hypothetical protein
MIKGINKLLKPVGVQIKSLASLREQSLYYENTLSAFKKVFALHAEEKSYNDRIEGMVFSKDRAIQLHALLASYFKNTKSTAPLCIIYYASTTAHKESYDELKELFNEYPVRFLAEADFRNDVISEIEKSGADRYFFLTDDGIFVQHFDFKDVLNYDPLKTVFSIGRGKNFDYISTHQKVYRVPDFTDADLHSQLFKWKIDEMKDSPAWYYPLSVDGNFFLRDELLILLRHISFSNPNSLEASLQIFIELFIPRTGICYSKTIFVNIPCNLVQNVFDNYTTGYFTTKDLLDKWNDGYKIEIAGLEQKSIYDIVHHKYSFVKRN